MAADGIQMWTLCPCCEEVISGERPGDSCEDCGEILIGVADASLLKLWERINNREASGV